MLFWSKCCVDCEFCEPDYEDSPFSEYDYLCTLTGEDLGTWRMCMSKKCKNFVDKR